MYLPCPELADPNKPPNQWLWSHLSWQTFKTLFRRVWDPHLIKSRIRSAQDKVFSFHQSDKRANIHNINFCILKYKQHVLSGFGGWLFGVWGGGGGWRVFFVFYFVFVLFFTNSSRCLFPEAPRCHAGTYIPRTRTSAWGGKKKKKVEFQTNKLACAEFLVVLLK